MQVESQPGKGRQVVYSLVGDSLESSLPVAPWG